MTDHYPDRMITLLEAIWGEGFLSPGGPAEVGRIIGEHEVRGRSVLDIGCGAGGVDVTLAEALGAGYVTGIDVEDAVLDRARAVIAARGLGARVGLVRVTPGPLPFPPDSFDIVFSKDSIIHIPDKRALMMEVFRVLKPGGWFVASDWLIGGDGPPSPQMAAYIAAEGRALHMASAAEYQAAMVAAGFTGVWTTSRNAWYRREARDELGRLRGPMGTWAADRVGQDFVNQTIAIWERLIPVLDSGEHCPTHLAAQKP